MADIDQYKSVLSALIKKQMIMLGPNVAIGTARAVQGLTVQDDGTVESISGDPQNVMQGVTNAYMKLSGQIAQMTLETILQEYPNIKQKST